LAILTDIIIVSLYLNASI